MTAPYRHRGRRIDLSTVDTRPGCGVCLDFGHLENLGPCPWCDPDAEAEYYLEVAAEIAAGMADAA